MSKEANSFAAGKFGKLEQFDGIAMIELMKGCSMESKLQARLVPSRTAVPLDAYCEDGVNAHNRR